MASCTISDFLESIFYWQTLSCSRKDSDAIKEKAFAHAQMEENRYHALGLGVPRISNIWRQKRAECFLTIEKKSCQIHLCILGTILKLILDIPTRKYKYVQI